MISSNKKISNRQAVILFIMATLSPAIRVFSLMTSAKAGKAGWLAPVVAVIPLIILIYIMNAFFKKNKEANLADVYCNVFGKVLGKILLVIYLIWILFLLVLYVRYYSERILSTIMPTTSNFFLISTMLILVFYASRKGIVPIARASEAFISIFIFVFAFIFIMSTPMLKYRNLMNVGYVDILPIANASITIISIWGYYLYLFFFGERINKKDSLKRFGLQGVGVLYIISTMIIITSIGALGSVSISHRPIPFFSVVKNISVFNMIERLESVILSLWVISDFIIILLFIYAAAAIMKSLFQLSSIKTVLSPIILFAGVGGSYIFTNRLELINFSEKFAIPTNLVFEFIIPVIAFFIGKLRKKL